jgi:hypothetical protein
MCAGVGHGLEVARTRRLLSREGGRLSRARHMLETDEDQLCGRHVAIRRAIAPLPEGCGRDPFNAASWHSDSPGADDHAV